MFECTSHKVRYCFLRNILLCLINEVCFFSFLLNMQQVFFIIIQKDKNKYIARETTIIVQVEEKKDMYTKSTYKKYTEAKYLVSICIRSSSSAIRTKLWDEERTRKCKEAWWTIYNIHILIKKKKKNKYSFISPSQKTRCIVPFPLFVMTFDPILMELFAQLSVKYFSRYTGFAITVCHTISQT